MSKLLKIKRARSLKVSESWQAIDEQIGHPVEAMMTVRLAEPVKLVLKDGGKKLDDGVAWPIKVQTGAAHAVAAGTGQHSVLTFVATADALNQIAINASVEVG